MLPTSGPIMCTPKHAVGLRIRQNLHEAFGGEIGLCPRIRREGNLPIL